MITVYIVGFNDSEAQKMNQRIVEILEKLRKIDKPEDACTVIIPAITQTCIFGHPSPKFVVTAPSQSTCHEVADEINDETGQCVDSITLNSSLSKKSKKK